MSQARPSRRPVAAATPEPDVPVVWNRQTWLALVVMAAVIAVVIGSGVLINKALQSPVPAATRRSR